MKALGVSLLIMAAVAASLTMARAREPEAQTDEEGSTGQTFPSEHPADLDAIRNAGF